MITKKDLISDREFFVGVDMVIKTYTLIAAGRIQKIRNLVRRNREFVEELAQIYQEVKSSYHQTESRKNGKGAYVFVSANAGLYGDVVPKVFSLFLAALEKSALSVEPVILGRVGQVMYRNSGASRSATYFDMADDEFDAVQVKTIVDYLNKYKDVVVFFGQFESISSQAAVSLDITGNLPGKRANPLGRVNYLFEPGAEKIAAFFEAEIVASFFVQCLLEARLARYASRMNYLDEASDRIKKDLKKLDSQALSLHHRLINARQIAALGGMNLWQS